MLTGGFVSTKFYFLTCQSNLQLRNLILFLGHVNNNILGALFCYNDLLSTKMCTTEIYELFFVVRLGKKLRAR